MSTIIERKIEDLTIRIDRTRCQSYGHCVDEAPHAFLHDIDGLADFNDPDHETRDALLFACEACPTAALSVFDADNNQLVPR